MTRPLSLPETVAQLAQVTAGIVGLDRASRFPVDVAAPINTAGLRAVVNLLDQRRPNQ